MTTQTPDAVQQDSTLRCDMCKRERDYSRLADPSIPAQVATIVVSRCDQCDDGDFGTEWWLDASGKEISDVG